MRFPAVRLTLAFLSLLVAVGPAFGQGAPRLVERINVRHIGPPAASDELVRANIRLKAGEPYLRSAADDDVRSLYATGYFYNIRIGEEMTDRGVVLTYVMQGKPTLSDIRFQGNKQLSTSRLKGKIKAKTGEPLNERQLFADAEEIKKYYQQQGYPRTAVKYAVTIDEEAGRGVATFEVTEQPRVRVVDVEFANATAFSQKTLREELKTRRWWMFSWLTGSGKLKDDEFDEDKEKLAEFYRSKGYIDFAIKDVQMDYKTPTRLIIRLVVYEGTQYKIGAIDFKGNTVLKADVIRTNMPFGVGKLFTPEAQSKNLQFLEDIYGARGYIDARIAPIKIPNTDRGTMDLVFNIDEKQQNYIEKIEIKGNAKTKDRVVRRELAVAPGEIFDMVRVKLSTNRLAGLQFFEKVEEKSEPTDVPNRKNLVIGLEEKSTGNFTVGAGFSSVDNLVGFVEMSQGNFDLLNPWSFTGGGQKFRLRMQVGTSRQDYLVSFVEPWLMGRRLALGVDLYHRDLNFQSSLYDERRTGGRVSLTRALGSEFLVGTVSYTLEQVSLLNLPTNSSAALLAEQGTRLVSRVGASLAYDTRNSSLLPNKGQRTELLTELAGGPFGGDTDYYKVELRSSWYFKGFDTGHVLELIGRVGVSEAYGDTLDVPLFDRYFLGGLYSLRGFDYRDVGPKDLTGEPLGGNTYYFASAEYSVPVFDRMRAAVFYDIGMVFRRSYSFSPGTFDTGVYNHNFGIGIRLNLPIGPLRLDYGIPIKGDSRNDNGGKFQFGVGYTREL